MTDINYRGLNIPRTQLGANVTTDNLFDPNEQVIFDFYEANKGRYRRALDIGANVGVHSILMARQGWDVRAYEPDSYHCEMFRRNVASHAVSHRARIELREAAVSDRDGTASFVRVLGNTTGSHLAGAKQSYGARVLENVETVDCCPLFRWADFAKIDCEGHEAVLVAATEPETWAHMDAMMEVGSPESAQIIYAHLCGVVPMWAQRTGWARVRSMLDMPRHHSDGSLFVGCRPPFEGVGV